VSDFKPARETTQWIVDSEAFEVKTGETHPEEYGVDHKGDRVDSFWDSVGLRTAKVEETEKVVNEQSKTTETKKESRISMNGLGAEKIKQYLNGSKDLDRFFLPVALKFLEGSFTKEDYPSPVYDPDGSSERNLKILQDFFAEKPPEDCKLELIFYPQTSNYYVSLRANNSKEFVSINLDRSNNLSFETSNRTDLVRDKYGPYHIQ